MSASANTAMPTFSYAQAARGLAPTKDKEASTEQTPKSPSKPESDASQPPSRSSRSRGRGEEKDTEIASNGAPTPTSVAEDTAEKENVPPKRASQQQSEATPSASTSPHLTGAIESPNEKDPAQQLDHSESWEKASHISTRGKKEPAAAHKEKAKETEDDWEKVSVPSVGSEKEKDKDKELKPAPPPPINIWAARQQAQEAKLRDLENQRTAAASQSAPPSAVMRSKSVLEGSKNKTGPKDSFEKEGIAGSRRSNESHRGNGRADIPSSQAIRPTSHHGEKDDSATAPAVNDVTSWPTPESAIADDRRKSGAQDKSEGRAGGSKAHGKQWVTMPFVPTAKFETQLPPAAARRGARSARGHSGVSRGGHASTAGYSGDRQESGSAMPPPPLPRHAVDQDRGRKPEGARGGRSSSLPTGHRRASSRESATTSTHKLLGTDNTALPVSTPTAAPDTDPTHNQRVSNFSSHNPSRSSSGHDGPNATKAPNGDLTASQITAESVADPFTVPTNEPNFRPAYLPDRSKPTQSSYRSSGDPARERGLPRNRDYSREKSDAAREKVESWRDRDYSGETNFRRETRPERGRGSYRGRGNHSASYQSSHAYTSPLPQNGFENPKASGGQEPRSRQSSQPFMMGTPAPSNRGIPRSQSIPVGTMYPGYYNNAPGVPQALSPLQTDMSTYGYPQMQMQPGIMSAMPYNDPLNSYAVLSMVMTQIEYYFSIDNLCKDLYLRKNMDSQGFVPLSVIANFKRIKTLTDEAMSMDNLRYVCQQVKSVDYYRGEDGKDRLRRRDGWEDFVLEKHERFPTAQNDGPAVPSQAQYMPMMPAMVSGEGLPFVPQQVRSPSATMPAMNGAYNPPAASHYGPVSSLDGHAGDQPLHDSFNHQMQNQHRRDATRSPPTQAERSLHQTLPFSPNHRPSGGMVNGHRRQVSRNFNEENVFPDDAIASINICVREPLPDLASADQPTMPVLNRVLSNESRGSNADIPPVSIPPRLSGLRGGAASPEQLARLQGVQFGFSSSQAAATEAPAFYSKEGEQTPIPPVKPGQYFVSYNALHDSSLKQREQGIEGAMKPMYSFWANFLVDKFNNGMYSEFKRLAEADLKEDDAAGIEHLMSYYRGALKSSAALSEHVALDLVSSLREEKDANRPVFKMMRIAWRDGALNLKTRKRIGDLLRDEEKAEFDKGG